MSGTASIGSRVKFQAPKAPAAEHEQHHQPALADREGEDGVNHASASPLPISAFTTKLFSAT